MIALPTYSLPYLLLWESNQSLLALLLARCSYTLPELDSRTRHVGPQGIRSRVSE